MPPLGAAAGAGIDGEGVELKEDAGDGEGAEEGGSDEKCEKCDGCCCGGGARLNVGGGRGCGGVGVGLGFGLWIGLGFWIWIGFGFGFGAGIGVGLGF